MSGEWIPVAERMPQQGVRCIIATRVPGRYLIDGEPKDGHEIAFGEWSGDRWKCFSTPCVSIMHPSMVSHWMPLPAPPTFWRRQWLTERELSLLGVLATRLSQFDRDTIRGLLERFSDHKHRDDPHDTQV